MLNSVSSLVNQPEVNIAKVPRSREVGQSWASTVLTTARASVVSFQVVWTFKPNLVRPHCCKTSNSPHRPAPHPTPIPNPPTHLPAARKAIPHQRCVALDDTGLVQRPGHLRAHRGGRPVATGTPQARGDDGAPRPQTLTSRYGVRGPLQVLRRHAVKVAFVESFARVQRLSLTGRLLYPVADVFLVQWPALAKQYPRARYAGILI